MSELTFNLLRLGYLLLLWFFVFSAVAVLRRDLTAKSRAAGRSRDDAGAGPWVNPAELSTTPPNPLATPNVGAAAGPPLVVVEPKPAAPQGAPIVVGPGANPTPPPPEPIVVGPKVPKYLAITDGALAGSMLPLTAGLPITIGRAPSNTLVIEDDYASGHHARLYPSDKGWVIEDLGSTNGTFVDNAPLLGSMVLPIGTPVTIGHSAFKLVM